MTNIHTQEYNRIVTERYSAVHKLNAQGKDFVYSWWNTSLNIAQAYSLLPAAFYSYIPHFPSPSPSFLSILTILLIVITIISSVGVNAYDTLSECYHSDVTAVKQKCYKYSTFLDIGYQLVPTQRTCCWLRTAPINDSSSRHNASVRGFISTKQNGSRIQHSHPGRSTLR